MEIKKYFSFNGKSLTKSVSAFAPPNVKLAQDQIEDFNEINILPYELNLMKISFGNQGILKSENLEDIKEIWLDYMPNSLAWPVLSEKIKNIIEIHLTGNEKLNWLLVIINGNGEKRNYFIPHFNKKLDVLDLNVTIFVGDSDQIFEPCFDFKKIKNFEIFPLPSAFNLWKITPNIMVSEKIKKEILKEKCTGINFGNVRISYS
jgi:hypothetical protein